MCKVKCQNSIHNRNYVSRCYLQTFPAQCPLGRALIQLEPRSEGMTQYNSYSRFFAIQQVSYFKMLHGAREMAQSLGATYFSCKEPVFGSKFPHGSLHTSKTPITDDLTPSASSFMHVVYLHSETYTYT